MVSGYFLSNGVPFPTTECVIDHRDKHTPYGAPMKHSLVIVYNKKRRNIKNF